MRQRASVYGRQSSNKAKSIDEQLQAGDRVVVAQKWQLWATYHDGSSASRFASKPRGGWAQVQADVAAKAFDVLVLWESSRGDRTAETWLGFLSACRTAGVRIHVITHDRTYNLANARDWKTLAEDGVTSAYETEMLSLRVRRGHSGAAEAGRPAMGAAPYGYRRVYDSATGKLTGQEPHPEEAPVIREIIERVARGEPISVIANDLNARQVPTGGAKSWYRARVRALAVNPAYIGLRVLNGATYPGTWEPLVSKKAFYDAQRVLTASGRQVSRPGRQKHLLSYLAICGVCGGPLCAVRTKYRCLPKTCVSADKATMDDLVTDVVLARLSQEDVYARLQQHDDAADQAATAAAGSAQALRSRLDEARLSAARGELSFASLAVIEADLTTQIAKADRAAQAAAVPPALRDMLVPGEDVRARWAAAGIPARRAVIRALASVVLDPAPARGVGGTERERLGGSRWHGEDATWRELIG